jgi:hypothetical protein
MFNKIISAGVLAVMLIAFTACGGTEEIPEETTAVTTLPPQVTEFVTITPPDAGWTLDTVNEVLYLNNRKYSIPFRFGDLGEGFTIPQKSEGEDNERFGGNVYYDGKPVFGVTGEYTDENKTLEDAVIDSIMVVLEMNQSDLPDKSLIVLNGLTIGTDISMIEEKMGTVSLDPAASTAYRFVYAVGETNNAILIDVDQTTKKIKQIWLILSFEVNRELDQGNTVTTE